MYGVVIGHLAVGILLPWISALSMFDAYHRSVESGFWSHGALQKHGLNKYGGLVCLDPQRKCLPYGWAHSYESVIFTEAPLCGIG